MQAQQKFTQPPKYGVTFPEGEQTRVSLYNRDSLTLACRGNERMASVLDYFLYEGSWEIDRQQIPEGCKVVEFTRKHGQILKRLTFNLSRKSLIGYLDTFNEWGFVNSEKFHNCYTVHFDTVQSAIDKPPVPKERKPRTRKGCKVEAITTEDTTSTLLQKVEELQRNVELLQPYVEEVQRLRCTCSTLQRDFSALVETLQGQSSEEHILLYYPLLSSLYQESAFANTHAPLAPSDFLPEENIDTDSHSHFDEDDRPTEHRIPAITQNGATDGHLDTPSRSDDRTTHGHALSNGALPPVPVAIANIPGEPDTPPSVLSRQSYTTPVSDGAATMGTGEPRPSDSGHSARAEQASQATLQLQAASAQGQNGVGTRQEKGKEVTQAIQKPLSLKEDEPTIRPETPAQRKRRIETREKEIWALVEEKLGTKFYKTHRQTKANLAGMEHLIEDETDDETIKTALDKLSDFWKAQFDLEKFHRLIPGLLATNTQKPSTVTVPVKQNYNGTGHAKRMRQEAERQALLSQSKLQA